MRYFAILLAGLLACSGTEDPPSSGGGGGGSGAAGPGTLINHLTEPDIVALCEGIHNVATDCGPNESPFGWETSEQCEEQLRYKQDVPDQYCAATTEDVLACRDVLTCDLELYFDRCRVIVDCSEPGEPT